MKKLFTVLLCIAATSVFATDPDQHFQSKFGEFIIPGGSIAHPENAGHKMYLNLVLFKPNNNFKLKRHVSDHLPGGETPASMACIYGLTTPVPGCPIDGTTAIPNTGWGAIAVVDAYDNPYAASDLHKFSTTFGLPDCTISNGCFQVVYASGVQPPYDSGWADEHVLDIEWAHAMAPNAKIIMVEAASESNEDLFAAVQIAAQKVLEAGGGMVSNSWGNSEFAGETNYDRYFQTPGVIYFASSGDYSAPARYPASSPYVIAAGGTEIMRDKNGNLIGEDAWSQKPGVPLGQKSGSSGGPSQYEPRPAFQNSIAKIVGVARGTPDIALDASPHSGVDVYSTARGGWFVDGGTSLSSPALAGLVNSANHRMQSSTEELNFIYNNALKNYHSNWHDILTGNNGFSCTVGYDFVTGLGSPLGTEGK